MKITWTIRITICFLMFLICSCAINKEIKTSFTFIQITDPQFGFFGNNKGFNEESLLYEKAVSKINIISPSFVIITGDLVNDKNDKMQWDEFRRITSLINPAIKVYLTPGNHDIGQNPEQKDIDHYESMFGDDKFSFQYKKCWFIGFNSCLVKAGTQGPEQEQFDWLVKELSAAKGTGKIFLFCHHPFFIKDPDEPENYSNINPESRKKYLSMFSEYGVDAIFSGHLHNNASGKFNEIELITTSASGKPLGSAPSGLRIINVSKEDFKHHYYPLDSLPPR